MTPRNLPSISIIILTHNEITNIADCLDSVRSFEDVHVLDSGSTDGTIELVESRGVKVHRNPFSGFGTQRNWAIDNISTRFDWHFHLDADERMTPTLTEELMREVHGDPPHGGYRVPSKLMLAGRWLKRAGQYPGYQVRFFHRDCLRFENHGHGQREVTSHSLGTLREPILHYGFSKGIDHWFTKHVGYARREAEQAVLVHGVSKDSILSRDAVARRRALKRLTSRLPGRYFLRLAYMLFWQGAILDGWVGVNYAHMLAAYEGMIEVYIRFLHHGIALETADVKRAEKILRDSDRPHEPSSLPCSR